jgi:hypothetical protein
MGDMAPLRRNLEAASERAKDREVEIDRLITVLQPFIKDGAMNTDPDGECYFCEGPGDGNETDPADDHDWDCPVVLARAVVNPEPEDGDRECTCGVPEDMAAFGHEAYCNVYVLTDTQTTHDEQVRRDERERLQAGLIQDVVDVVFQVPGDTPRRYYEADGVVALLADSKEGES